MATLDSPVDTKSLEFRTNAAQMRALVEELKRRRAEAALGGPARARERHVARGKLLPRERVLARPSLSCRRSRRTACTRTPSMAPD
jgi:3-methylcrotonyl-CoA carboxylase beta subunit